MRSLRLGFVTARAASLDGDRIWTDSGLGRFIDELARRFPQMLVTTSVAPERQALFHHPLAVPRQHFRALPWLPSVALGFFKALPCRDVIREMERHVDVTLVQLPFAAPAALVAPVGPRVYHVCADVKAIATTSPAYRGVKHLAAHAVSGFMADLQAELAIEPRARVVTNGRDLLSQLPGAKGRAVVSSALYDAEVDSVRRTRPVGAPFRVLFVGYLRPEKGIGTLLTAFERLLDDIPDAELVVVGASSTIERGTAAEVTEGVRRLQELGRVQLLGKRDFGPELFECFAEADALVLPSLSEGTPRVLVEARAFRCPVIASRVGGIPTSVDDGVDGLLFPPGDAPALHQALLRVATDRELRAGLIERGLERARACTVEKFVDQVAEEILAAAAEARR